MIAFSVRSKQSPTSFKNGYINVDTFEEALEKLKEEWGDSLFTADLSKTKEYDGIIYNLRSFETHAPDDIMNWVNK